MDAELRELKGRKNGMAAEVFRAALTLEDIFLKIYSLPRPIS